MDASVDWKPYSVHENNLVRQQQAARNITTFESYPFPGQLVERAYPVDENWQRVHPNCFKRYSMERNLDMLKCLHSVDVQVAEVQDPDTGRVAIVLRCPMASTGGRPCPYYVNVGQLLDDNVSVDYCLYSLRPEIRSALMLQQSLNVEGHPSRRLEMPPPVAERSLHLLADVALTGHPAPTDTLQHDRRDDPQPANVLHAMEDQYIKPDIVSPATDLLPFQNPTLSPNHDIQPPREKADETLGPYELCSSPRHDEPGEDINSRQLGAWTTGVFGNDSVDSTSDESEEEEVDDQLETSESNSGSDDSDASGSSYDSDLDSNYYAAEVMEY